MITKKYLIKIDTTNKTNKSVALFLAKKQVDILVGNLDVVQSIKFLLLKNNLNLEKDILEVMPNTGPGSFTGIKTGIVIANTINWYIGNKKVYKPLYGIHPLYNI